MYGELVKKHLEGINKLKCQNSCIIVYKGFPIYFINSIKEKIDFLNNIKNIFTNNKIDLKKINSNINILIQKLLKLSNSKHIMLYEEFCILHDNINLELFDGIFYIYENNIFYKYPNQSNCKYIDIESEIDKGYLQFEENNLFNKFYSNSLIKNNHNFIQYRDLTNLKIDNVKIKNFFPKEIFGNRFIEETNIEGPLDEKSLKEIEIPLSDNQDDEKYNNLIYDIFFNKPINDVKLLIDEPLLKKADDRYINEIKALKYIFEANNKNLILIFKKNIIKSLKSRKAFYKILYNHWNSKEFRNLLFYRNPDFNREKIEISQDSLIELIVNESENAYKGETFSDIFITAPTGSGKSILFQIPAIYIAKKQKSVSMVVTPLKALMYDQVTALNQKGIHNAAYINSDVSFFDREETIKKVKNGEIDILYLSPELLLSYNIDHFIGNRLIGLLVIDEAHLVTTWGRDFRVDYWFLGNYIQKLRKYSNRNFPVLALTATAVYQGPDDIVFETISSLNIKNVKIYIGNVVRNEIRFQINEFKYEGSYELKKINNTVQRIKNNIDNKIKTIVYCPYVSHVNNILRDMPVEYIKRVGRYHGSLTPEEKEVVVENFKKGIYYVIIATKAFGMGIDINDIKEIYHHAPSGNLYDYVQEIGRVARDKNIKGFAVTDFHKKDFKYTRTLFGLSSIKQYQVKLVLEKLFDIYYANGQKQNMLLSPEDFGYIFWLDRDSLENKVKSALLLLEKDLLSKYRFNILIVRPKSLFTTVFACVDKKVDKIFVSKYGEYIKEVSNVNKNKREQFGSVKFGNVKIHDIGKIYEVKLDKIWEIFFNQESFPSVKWKFFNRSLFEEISEYIIPRYKLTIRLEQKPKETVKKLNMYFKILSNTFSKLYGKYFSRRDIERELKSSVKDSIFRKRISNLLLSLFTSRAPSEESGYQLQFDTFIQPKRTKDGIKYRIIDYRYDTVINFIVKKFSILFSGDNEYFQKYIAADNRETEFRIKIAYLLEALNLGSYQLDGGHLPQIFIRINDPYKIRNLSQSEDYKNNILSDVEKRHKRGMLIMEKFFTSKYKNEERWDFIEDYFQGEEVVESNY